MVLTGFLEVEATKMGLIIAQFIAVALEAHKSLSSMSDLELQEINNLK